MGVLQHVMCDRAESTELGLERGRPEFTLNFCCSKKLAVGTEHPLDCGPQVQGHCLFNIYLSRCQGN